MMGVTALALEMGMVEWKVVVGMLKDLRVARWPEAQGEDRPGADQPRQQPQSCDWAELRHQPARQRIGDEPACVAERRVSGSFASSDKKEKIRHWAMRETRPEQQEFRRKIAERDGLRCAISHCELPEILDAAHLLPRADGGSDAPQNGIILRADLHRLFDAGLLKLDCGGRATISETITDQNYQRFHEAIAQSGADFGLLTARPARSAS